MAAVAAFAAITALVGTGLSDAFDEAVLATLLPYRSQPAIDAVQLVTLLGSPILSSVLALGLTVRLVATDGRRGLVPLLFFAGFAVELALKAVIFQPGPPSELVYDAPLFVSLREVTAFTYPSGHAMRIAFLASIVAWRVPRLRIPLAVVVALIAFGRVFLAAGWITDAAGGVCLGIALGALASLVAERLGSPRRAPRAALVTP